MSSQNTRFQDFSLDPSLQRGIRDLGFDEPTPIQAKSIPPALEGRDILAAAMTGSGKTAAFCLPLLQRLVENPSPQRRGSGIRALVLTPTRELAAQVEEHLAELGRHARVTSTSVYGGVKPARQIKALRNGVDVVVATPGRLLDHMSQPWMNFDDLEVLVLDEADRMLDMGFLPDVKRILRTLPKQRQTLLFSATLPRPIVDLSRTLLDDPARINVERKSAPAAGITQELLPVGEPQKRALLLELLRRGDLKTALVFTRTKHRANRLHKYLDQAGISSERIHGNRSQSQRQKALDDFRSGRVKVLVATDVAARGIDVEELPHVVNFDVPGQAEDYIHRVGRTARAKSTGDAWTFVSPKDTREVRNIERAIGRSLPRRCLEGFDYDAKPEERFEVPVGERIAAHRARNKKSGGRKKPGNAKAGNGKGGNSNRGNSNRGDSNHGNSNRGQAAAGNSGNSGNGRPSGRRRRRRGSAASQQG